MKIFLSADMEGTCGIVSWPETERSAPFDYSRKANERCESGRRRHTSQKTASACFHTIARLLIDSR